MSYVLDITFTGMCGFVPVDRAGVRAVHVLFPDTSRPDAHGPSHEGHEGHGTQGAGPMDAHVSRLLFDTTALRPGATESDDRWPVVVSLEKRALVFGAGAMLNPDVSSEFAPLRYLKPGFLDDAANEFITSRVVLHAGGQLCADSGAIWLDEKDKVRPMSHQLAWRIDGLTEPLRLTLQSLDDQVDRKLPPLYPDASGKLALHILHVPRVELPPEPQEVEKPKPGTPAHHFSALNLLVTEPVKRLPVFVREPQTSNCPESDRGMSPYTCLGARIELEPPVE